MNKTYSTQKLKNSLSIEVHADEVYEPRNLDDLLSLPDLTVTPFYILGEGSNTLFIDRKAPLIIMPRFKGIKIEECGNYYNVTVGAGENWHQLVLHCVNNNVFGLENLALIPGSAGGAPVQNIGAYGAEFSDFCDQVHWFDFETKSLKVIENVSCKFGYRDSIFKQALYNKGIITHITLKLPKLWQRNLAYKGLDHLPNGCSAIELMNTVINLRNSKLPDPNHLPNAGSFFKNPILSNEEFIKLQAKYPDVPSYPQDNNVVKVAAGWLIEQAGLKGFRKGNAGVHVKQALVLVNFGKSTGTEIAQLAKHIQDSVFDKFSITLHPEVKMVTSEGELQFKELII